ncbi:hypothetical protein BmR1_04g08875 [Babesia microti strain RI]|uniref:EF-hand domain-containing protein n=1 Tax=Babesia microti (strain RI) TaxID=1133968 RepID=I7IHK1_BABMR|nr:hypothetical protein BmR1_04g08875 [Babesia microti strain RI]CCF75952.1 hypothetical protein BmR1_04g08875 [Babesia microti strain RI]|eukprot:XP_012650360.1 hypothetical protein BmR1_04g08875 [Babesia microti strain RI]
MYKAVDIWDKFFQILATLGAMVIAYVILNFEETHFSVEKREKSEKLDLNLINRINFELLLKDPPETRYIVVKASENHVSSHALMTNLATILSNKLATSRQQNLENIRDLTKFIPQILEHRNAVLYSVGNDTVTVCMKLLTELLEDMEIVYHVPHNRTTLEKLISMKTCDLLQNNNVEQFIHLNPFVKIDSKYERNNIYSTNLIRLMVKNAVYEYIEKISSRFGKVYGLWWKEEVSNAVTRIFIRNMENNEVSTQNLRQFGEELEATLTSLGQFIFLDINKDDRLSSDELMHIFEVPNAEISLPFIFLLFKIATSRYSFTISMIDFIIFNFSLRITDDATSAQLCNIVRL